VVVPIDAAEVRLTHESRRDGGSPLLVATEIPIVMPSTPTAFLANGDPLEPDSLELSEVESLRFESAEGALEVTIEPAGEVWCKLAGPHLLVVPVVRVEGEMARTTIRIAWTSATTPPVARAALTAAVGEGDTVGEGGEAAQSNEGAEGGEEVGDEKVEGEALDGVGPPAGDEDEQPR
jgi:hypothetical protein